MELESRRSFNQRMLGSLLAYGLVETVFSRGLLADSVKPVVHKWMGELNELCHDLKGHKMKDSEFQSKLEELYRKVDLAELVKLLELDRLTANLKYPDKGAASLGMDFRKVEGLPARLAFGKQIFAVKKGRSVVPHGHDNMCTGFIVLRGDFHGKHYDRIEDREDHYLMKPTIDRRFKPGECSTISDHKDNVHWFMAESDTAFIFNVHVDGYNADSDKAPRRVYVDADGEKVQGGLIVAKKISSKEAHRKYG
jgi:hypothetical protein